METALCKLTVPTEQPSLSSVRRRCCCLPQGRRRCDRLQGAEAQGQRGRRHPSPVPLAAGRGGAGGQAVVGPGLQVARPAACPLSGTAFPRACTLLLCGSQQWVVGCVLVWGWCHPSHLRHSVPGWRCRPAAPQVLRGCGAGGGAGRPAGPGGRLPAHPRPALLAGPPGRPAGGRE